MPYLHRPLFNSSFNHLNGSFTIDWVGDDFNPVTIGIGDKGNVMHLSVLELLDEVHVKLLKTIAGLLDIINSDTDMTKTAARLLVAA